MEAALTRVLSSKKTGRVLRFIALRLRSMARIRQGDHSLALEDLIRLQTLGDETASLRAIIASTWRRMDADTGERRFQDA